MHTSCLAAPFVAGSRQWFTAWGTSKGKCVLGDTVRWPDKLVTPTAKTKQPRDWSLPELLRGVPDEGTNPIRRYRR
jgi:hypothetical protein